MKTALLAQNEALEAKTLNPDVKKSMLPLSHSVTFPVDVDGAIYPICCVEVVPSDSYKISNEVLLRQLQPLKVPVMTKYTLNTAYFYCSNRLAWKKWAMFADQANKGRSDVSYTFALPQCANIKVTDENKPDKYSLLNSNGDDITYANALHTYFDISLNRTEASPTPAYADFKDNSDDLPLAFPMFDYQLICRDFYTNIDRIPDTPDTEHFYDYDDPFADWAFTNLYPVDDDEIKLVDGPQLKSGFVSGDDGTENITGFCLDKMRYHDLRYDYFTSSKRAPMRGEAPSVDTSQTVTSVDFTKSLQSVADNYSYDLYVGLHAESDLYDGEPTDANLFASQQNKNGSSSFNTAGNATNYGIPVKSSTQNDRNNHALLMALNKAEVKLSTATKVTAANLMLLTSLTMWQTLNMLHKPYYNDFLNAHFDKVKVGDSLAEKPLYIGGTSVTIDINEVLQTSESTASSKLGSQAAVAHALNGSNVGEFYAHDFGFIIGVAYILPDLVYDPALPRWASRRAIEDYYFPEFANLSMQATLNKELFFSNDDEWNNQPLGYVGAFDELRSIPNYCAGDLLNPSYSDLRAWILRHDMDNSNKPAINQRFLSAKGNVDMTAWTVPSAPKFMLQCANFVEAMRPMPYIAVPQLKN